MNRINLKCIASTYIDEFYPNRNFLSKEYILSGMLYKNSSNFNKYKSLLEFSILNLNTNAIKSVFLCLFVKDLNFAHSNAANIKIIATDNALSIANVTWSNYSNATSSDEAVTVLYADKVGKYVEIDITNIFKDSLIYTNYYGLTVDIIKHNYTSIVQFASVNSVYPPYLAVNINTNDNNIIDKVDYNLNDEDKADTNINEISEDSSVTEENNIIGREEFEDLLSNFKNLDSKLYTIEQLISEKVDSLGSAIKLNNEKVDSLTDWIKLSNDKVEALITWIKLSNDKIDSLVDVINLKDDKIDSLSVVINETNTKVDSMVDWIKSISTKVDSLGDWINATNSKVESLSVGINITNSKVEYFGEISELTNSKVDALKDIIDSTNNKVKDSAALIELNNSKVGNLKKIIDSTNNKMKDSGELIELTNSKLDNLKDIINSTNRKAEYLASELKLINNNIESLTNNKLEKEVENINTSLLKVNDDIDRLVSLMENIIIETF